MTSKELQKLIQEWLDNSNPDFIRGYELLCSVSHNRSLQHYLLRKRDLPKLKYALGKYRDASSIKIPRTSLTAAVDEISFAPVATKDDLMASDTVRMKIDVDGKINREDLPDPLKELFDLNVEEYQLMRATHEKMKLATTDTDRALFRKNLDAFDDSIAARWAVIDQWVATGFLSTPSAVPSGTPVSSELTPKDVNAYKAYITRSLNSLAGIKDDAEKATRITTIREKAQALRAMGHTFKPETLERMQTLGIG